jgi:adenylyltransferase/sulfurtransferase
VLLIGAGGLGSPAALYLAAAGVGTLGLVDFDNVDITNLQRQILHGTKDVGRPKLQSARERLADVNPHVRLETYETALTSKNALDIFSGYDIVVDGTDNFATRYLVNDACVLQGKPNVYGSIFRFEGHYPTDLAIAACSRSRRRRDWCRAAPKAVCWACCRVWWGRFRRRRRSS